MRGVGVEEAAAIGAQLLDRFLPGHGTQGDGLLRAFERRGLHRGLQGLRHAGGEKAQRDEKGDGQQDIEGGAGQIDPEIAERRGAGAGEGAGDRQGQGDAGRGGEEIMHRQPGHLREMAHRRLAAIGLPVGVGQEADGGVEGEVGRDVVEPLRVERQVGLQAQDGVERNEARGGKGQHGQRIGQPALLALRVHAGQRVETALQRPENGREEGAFALEDMRHVKAERPRGERDEAENQRDLQPAGQGHGSASSETFRIEQGENEIGAQPQRYRQAKDWFEHGNSFRRGSGPWRKAPWRPAKRGPVRGPPNRTLPFLSSLRLKCGASGVKMRWGTIRLFVRPI